MAQSIGRSFGASGNNFDALRLAGAWLVLVSHSFALAGQPAREPLARMLDDAADGGRLAVGMFFVVSGFLVTRSVQTHPPARYLRARLLRLWPGLAVILLVQTFVIGPICTVLPLATYLSDPATWTALARGLVFNPRLGLPGLFASNPVSQAVNGSLWTLRVELACYVLLLGAAMTNLLGRLTLAALAAGLLALTWLTVTAPASLPAALSWLLDPRVSAILECLVQFAMGALIWAFRDALPCSARLCGAGLLALLVAAHTAAAPMVFHLVFPYVIVCIGLAPPLAPVFMHRLGDISYGTYLYAFPVQQAVIDGWGGPIGPWQLAAVATPPVLVLALLSRAWVEQPALRLKQWLDRRGGGGIVGGSVVVKAGVTARPPG